MNKEDCLKQIAETAYNIGFGAKKHFATFDIVAKVPGLIGFFSMVIGIYALIFESLNAKFISATLVVFGVMGIYISLYDSKKDSYVQNGNLLIDLFNELKTLYRKVKSSTNPTNEQLEQLSLIEQRYTKISNSHQILFSNWYAHYKFFWEHQIDWIDEQLNFQLFRDKIPLSLMFALFVIICGVLLWCSNIVQRICHLLSTSI